MKSGKLIKTAFIGAIMLLLSVGLAACGSDPAPTPAASAATVQPTANPQPTSIAAPVATPTTQPTVVPQPTAVAIAVATPTVQPTAIPRSTTAPVAVATPTAQPTAIPRPTATAVAVATPTPEPIATPEPSSTVPFDVEIVANIDYIEDANYPGLRWDLLDLYLPKGQEDFPVVMLIHGGGMVIGDKEIFSGPARYLASQGFGIVNINYRLATLLKHINDGSPYFGHPAQIQDSARAFAWTHENIQSYGGNPNQIFVIGQSAGAYLAALLASDGKYLAEHGLSTTDIRGGVPVSGQFRIDQMDPEYDKATMAIIWPPGFAGRREMLWGEDVEGWVAASPNTYLSAETPPALFLYADDDLEGRKEMSEKIAAELRDAGQPNSVAKVVANTDHFSVFLRLGIPGEESNELILAFLKDNL